MSVIIELHIPADEFELGRILEVEHGVRITLETMIPLGEKAVPFFSVHDHGTDTFEEAVRNHPSVEDLHLVSEHDDERLYALDWKVSRDLVFQGFLETEAQLLEATGTATTWEFELRFPTHENVSAFQEYCTNAHVSMVIDRIYNPTKPESGPWFGLTPRQRETLVLAVTEGYYSIPRRTTTEDLARELGISDQAVTERLRRAIVALAESTLLVAGEASGDREEDGGERY